MREEEKKAVEHLNSFLNIPEFVWIKESELLMINVKIVLNLIENQQKELNNLKEIEKSHKKENGKLRVELEQYKMLDANIEKANDIIERAEKIKEKCDATTCEMIKKNYIHKNKIREKIKEYDGLKIIDKQAYEEQIKPLKELWEDNNG